METDPRKHVVLVTWKGNWNYGTSLQSFSLHRVLQDLGYYVKFLPQKPEKYGVKTFLLFLLSLLGIKSPHFLFRSIKKGIFNYRKYIKFRRFQRLYYHEIALYSLRQENKLVFETDCFISGSDQIWNSYYKFSPFFFLSFAGNTKRIAYGPSIGTNSIKSEYKDQIKDLLASYSHIGVRENEAVRVLSELTGRNDIKPVLDPTFLLSPTDWDKVTVNAEFEIALPKKYILCYFVGNNESYEKQLLDVKTHVGIDDIIVIPSRENPYFTFPDSINYTDCGPVEFVWFIQHASFVCTDSFHATALSINHSIPFVEFLRFKNEEKKSQNSRIFDLLTHYNLLDRIYKESIDDWSKRIDYENIQKILTTDRKTSLNFLINAIEN